MPPNLSCPWCVKQTSMDQLTRTWNRKSSMSTNSADIVHALNMHFCYIGDRLSNNIPDSENEYKQFLANNIRYSFFLAPIDEADVLREIKNLARNKAPGPDNIGNKLLKLDPQIFCYHEVTVPIWPPQSVALNCEHQSQWLYTQCGPATTIVFSSCHYNWFVINLSNARSIRTE